MLSLTKCYVDQVIYGAIWDRSCEMADPDFEAAIINILATQMIDCCLENRTIDEANEALYEVDILREILIA